jgi:glycosyltransferase involved in cell wall biosynthesis
MKFSGTCLVTTEYPGLGPSGGIGTYVETLAGLFKGKSNLVILHAGPCPANVRYLNISESVTLVNLNSESKRLFTGGTSSQYSQSLSALDWLREQNFSHINFPDWNALGFASIAAKRLKQDFRNTTLSVTMHGTTAWAKSGNIIRPEQKSGFEFGLIEDLEKFSLKYCDLLLSPSKYLGEWVHDNLDVDREIKVICNPYLPKKESQKNREPRLTRGRNVSFFGRVENRKGIQEFLEALKLINPKDTNINIVGRNTIGKEIFAAFKDEDWYKNLIHLENLTSTEALAFLKESDSLVVVPSKIENCPYVVQELCDNNLRVICNSVGGIPELIGLENRYDGSIEALAGTILNYINDPISVPKARPLQNVDANNTKWFEILNSNQTGFHDFGIQSTGVNTEIGIVIPHYNQSKYLRATLDSLLRQNFQGFKCIVIDDGSDDRNLMEFRKIVQEYREDRLIFREQPNEDVGRTRNLGAELLKTDVITFLDSDDVLEVDFLERLSKVDFKENIVVTSHFMIFNDNPKNSSDVNHLIGTYEPVGGISSKSWYRNFLGGSNFALRRQLFLDLGGFTVERRQNHQDWRFLVRAQNLGVEVLSLPYRLLNYRVMEESMTRTRSHLNGHLSVMEEFLVSSDIEKLRSVTKELMESFILSTNQNMDFQFISSTERLVRKIQRFALRITPYGTRRWRIALVLYRKIVK